MKKKSIFWHITEFKNNVALSGQTYYQNRGPQKFVRLYVSASVSDEFYISFCTQLLQ